MLESEVKCHGKRKQIDKVSGLQPLSIGALLEGVELQKGRRDPRCIADRKSVV